MALATTVAVVKRKGYENKVFFLKKIKLYIRFCLLMMSYPIHLPSFLCYIHGMNVSCAKLWRINFIQHFIICFQLNYVEKLDTNQF